MGEIMNIQVITSMNQEYYDRIGKDCIDSYLRHWSLPLTVYAESVNLPRNTKIHMVDFTELGQDYEDFQSDGGLSRRCRTFAKKAFSVLHAMTHARCDWVVWIDADVITQRSDPTMLLKKILHPRYLAMYMGVQYHWHEGTNKHGDWLVPETGLFGVNMRHPLMPRFREEYHRRYQQRDFGDLRRSYDNDVLGAAIRLVPADYLDLCAGLDKPYKTPLKHTVFGEYLTHHKAKHSKLHYADNQ